MLDGTHLFCPWGNSNCNMWRASPSFIQRGLWALIFFLAAFDARMKVVIIGRKGLCGNDFMHFSSCLTHHGDFTTMLGFSWRCRPLFTKISISSTGEMGVRDWPATCDGIERSSEELVRIWIAIGGLGWLGKVGKVVALLPQKPRVAWRILAGGALMKVAIISFEHMRYAWRLTLLPICHIHVVQ